MMEYVVSQHRESGLWYAHMEGYSYIPVLGSFSETRAGAVEWAAASMGMTLKDYRQHRSHLRPAAERGVINHRWSRK